MPKPTRLLCAIAAASALLPAATASAQTRPVKFRVEIKATQTSTWKQPYHETAGDCFSRPWRQGEGGEVVRFRGKGIAYAHRIGRHATWTYASPQFGPSGKPGIPLKATNERRSHTAHGEKPGPCGGGSPEVIEPAECGTRTANAFGQIAFSSNGRRLALRALDASKSSTNPLDFDRCAIDLAEKVDGAWLTEISQRAPSRELLDPDFKKHIVIARKQFTRTLYPTAARIDMTTNVFWQVTLRRLG